MNDKDRIRLAEAMGWRLQKVEDAPLFGLAVGTQRWVNPAGSLCIDVVDLPFNPFTDANDDYAVLEWMTNQKSPNFLLQVDADARRYPGHYLIGDYAKACLKVLDEQ